MLTMPIATPYGELNSAIYERAKAIRLLICDVDGVLSNGFIYMGNQGEELKTFSTRDGAGIKALLKAGIEVAVITGRSSRIVSDRMGALGVRHLVQGADEKLPHYEALCQMLQLAPEQVAYIGDDCIDLPVMNACGLGIAVKDAHPIVLAQADWVTTLAGGMGAVREVSDIVLQAQGRLDCFGQVSV